MASNNSPTTRLATRLAFFVAGFAISCWAPLVPPFLALDVGRGVVLMIAILAAICFLEEGAARSR
jgi:hypothetical protein